MIFASHHRHRVRKLMEDDTENIAFWDGAKKTAVEAVVTIVAEHDVFVLTAADHPLLEGGFSGKGPRFRRKIRFIQSLAVDEDMATIDVDAIARPRDDAFDVVALVGRVFDHDDVAWSWIAIKVIVPALEQIVIRIMKGGIHADPIHFDGFDQVMADSNIAGVTQSADHGNAPNKTPKQPHQTNEFDAILGKNSYTGSIEKFSICHTSDWPRGIRLGALGLEYNPQIKFCKWVLRRDVIVGAAVYAKESPRSNKPQAKRFAYR